MVVINAFKDGVSVERLGWQAIEPVIRDRSGGIYTPMFNNDAAQAAGYDVLATIEGRERKLELKCEAENKHGTFFIETWSNFAPMEQQHDGAWKMRANPGWMMKCTADLLLYYFLDTRKLYWIPFPKFTTWFFKEASRAKKHNVLRRQSKRTQMNDTRGHGIDISAVRHEVGFWELDVKEDGTYTAQQFKPQTHANSLAS